MYKGIIKIYICLEDLKNYFKMSSMDYITFRIPIAANSIESILCEAIKLEFSAYSTLGGMETRKILNDAERAKLNELIVANKALLAPLDEDITNLIGEDCKFKVIFIFKMV